MQASTSVGAWEIRGDQRQSRDFGPCAAVFPDGDAGRALIDEGLELLDEPEALRLLANSEVGRVGVTIGRYRRSSR